MKKLFYQKLLALSMVSLAIPFAQAYQYDLNNTVEVQGCDDYNLFTQRWTKDADDEYTDEASRKCADKGFTSWRTITSKESFRSIPFSQNDLRCYTGKVLCE